MSWLPTFLNPWAALIAGGLAAAALIGLYFLKLRRQEKPVSSTLLWKKSLQDLQVNTPFQKLRRNLLLILQLLLLLFLSAALARPVIDFSPGAGAVSILLIDHSASMNATDAGGGRTRLDEARRRAKALISTMDRDARAMVIAFADSARVVQPFTSDRAELARAIDSIRPTDRATRLKPAIRLIEAQQRESGPAAHVWLFSDGRASDRDEVSFKSPLTFDSIGSTESSNIAIVALDGRRNYQKPREVEVFTRLANFGPKPLKADVELKVDGMVAAVKSVSLAPRRWSEANWTAAHPGQADAAFTPSDSLGFSLDLPRSAVITVEQMNVTHDALKDDDSASLVVPPPKPLRVLLVTPGNYFLERALKSLQLRSLSVLSPAQYQKNHPGDADVIIFDRFAPPADSLPPAGRFIEFDAVPEGMDLKPVLTAGKPLMLRNLTPLDWDRDQPILRELLLGRLYVAAAMKLHVPQSDQILIDGTGGPLMILHRQRQAIHLLIPFDLLQSNWPLQVSFPIFLHNALRYMALGSSMDVRQSLAPGDAPVIARAVLARADSKFNPIQLTGPDGTQSIPIPPQGDLTLPPLERVGLYRLRPQMPEAGPIAVNMLDADESNLMPATIGPGSPEHVASATAPRRGRLDLWWWIIACLFVPMLLIEWYVYTRRARL